ncbi:MAG: ABC transporter substrate-binding protein [Vicinamibacterales bacterium]
MRPRVAAWMVGLAMAAACGSGGMRSLPSTALLQHDWAEIEQQARGTTVSFAMWAGEDARNRFYQGPVTQTLRERFGIELRIVPLTAVADVINRLLNEKRAGRDGAGAVDLIWLNGENFRTARQGDLLWGPFADRLPNIVHFDAQVRLRDFGTPTEGYEAPVESAQFVFAYDSTRIAEPPPTLAALRAWIEAHPGRFTYPAIPDFTGSAFIRHVLYHAGGEPPVAFVNGFDEGRYARASTRAIAWLREIKPFLWRQGETYPATPADLDRLFVNGEVDFSMNYRPTFAAEKIARGEFPTSTRTFGLQEGTIFNYSFLAVPFNAANPAGALTVTNYFLSPEHAIARSRMLGGLFPQRLEGLTPDARAAVDALAPDPATLPLDWLEAHRIPEGDAEYLIRFEKDWQRRVLR